ncbi:unnamed protein product, partial [Tetraodon nigroviridis]
KGYLPCLSLSVSSSQRTLWQSKVLASTLAPTKTKLTATTHDGGSMADYEGSWSCIERRAQSGAAALIKT